MSYQKKTIKATLGDINSGKMYLPAIQRKYVWSDDQIIRLMDSILLNYPIGTFLFWNVSGNVINEKQYSLYEFIKNYHERDAFINPHAPTPITKESVYAVLDGQQRLTSLFIALQGSLAMKLPMKRWNNDDAFPKKELYLNLKSKRSDEEDELSYEFAFFTEQEASKSGSDKLWYKVKEILKYHTSDEVLIEVVTKNGWRDQIVMRNILALHRNLVLEEVINFFEIDKDSIDDVLDIFIRVNAGGTVLSKSDLLFSTVVSHWDKARDEIEELLKTINAMGEKFRFTTDFIMRTCLYVLDLPVHLKVESFKRESVEKIKRNWTKIRSAILDTVKLLDEFGFNFENIISYVAIIPMVYYIYNDGQLDAETKFELRKYIVIAQLKQIFGTASNAALTSIREKIVPPNKRFQMKQLSQIRFTGDRNLRFSEPEIDTLFDLGKGAYTFMILSLLYPHLKYSQKGFHQDHMHPYSAFSDKILADIGLTPEKRLEWQTMRNRLANLQLLEGHENIHKKNETLVSWLKSEPNRIAAKYLPEDVSYELKDFEIFLTKRQELMKQALESILL
ncbi:MAG TPA: DUF262 domain-containing protein [Bacillota bacterium]|nr:DUF262 domain-containing protein [Bacillota bacterium]